MFVNAIAVLKKRETFSMQGYFGALRGSGDLYVSVRHTSIIKETGILRYF